MTTPIVFNNNNYSFPTVGDLQWGQTVTAITIDFAGNIVTLGTAQTISGAKTFNGTVSFGGLFITNAIKDQSANGTLSLLIDGVGNVTVTKNFTVQGTTSFNAISGTTVTGGTVITTGLFRGSVSTNLVAAGTTQGTALALTSLYNEIGTVNVNTGVALPVTAGVGDLVRVWNLGVNNLSVYPPSGDAIDGLGTNTAYSLPPLKSGDWVMTSGTTWRTQNNVATYS